MWMRVEPTHSLKVKGAKANKSELTILSNYWEEFV
jgi:hypothetical protein